MPIKVKDVTKSGEVCRNLVGKYGGFRIRIIETILPRKEALEKGIKSVWYYQLKDNSGEVCYNSRDEKKFETVEECVNEIVNKIDNEFSQNK